MRVPISVYCVVYCWFMFAAKLKRNQENAGEDAEMQSMNSGTVLSVTSPLFFLYN